jgi:hypothetical protein
MMDDDDEPRTHRESPSQEDGADQVDHAAELARKEAEVRKLSAKTDAASQSQALKVALSSSPSNGTAAVKDKSLQLVVNVLSAIKTADIDGVAKTLSGDEADLLMQVGARRWV